MKLTYNIKLKKYERRIKRNVLLHLQTCIEMQVVEVLKKYCEIKFFPLVPDFLDILYTEILLRVDTIFINDQNLIYIHILAKLLQGREKATGSHFSVVKGTRGQVPCKLYGRTGGSAPIVPQMTA
jgi:hypothetical protein